MRVSAKEDIKNKQKKEPIKKQETSKYKEIFIIEDFLQKHNFKKTLEVFDKEWRVAFNPQKPLQNIINAFKEGDHRTFFKLWFNLDQANIDTSSGKELNNINFYLRVYFIIYNVNPEFSNREIFLTETINIFKKFLDEKGEDFTTEKEYAPFFILPYVKNVRFHSSFSFLFTKKWTENLLDKLKKFLQKIFTPVSVLEDLISKEIFAEKEKDTIQRFLIKDCLEVGFIILDSLKQLKLTTEQEILNERLLKRLKDIENAIKSDIEIPQQDKNVTKIDCLDISRLKESLQLSKDNVFISAVFQALRNYFSKAHSALKRREISINISSNDLIDYKLFTSILDRKSKQVSEQLIALINALASEYIGRSYLIENSQLIKHLIFMMKAEAKETFLRKNCLGILQKLSLRRKPQEILVNSDIIKWAVGILSSEKEALSDYSVEYISALLLNLSLRTMGKEKFEEIKYSALTLLGDLLNHKNGDVKSFVNGTLYSLFFKCSIKKLALEMGFEKKIKDLMEASNDELRTRYKYILDQLTSENNDANFSQLNEDENDFDILEDEEKFLEEENEKPSEVNYHLNDDEIILSYKLEGEKAEKQLQIVSSILEGTFNQSRLENIKPYRYPFGILNDSISKIA